MPIEVCCSVWATLALVVVISEREREHAEVKHDVHAACIWSGA